MATKLLWLIQGWVERMIRSGERETTLPSYIPHGFLCTATGKALGERFVVPRANIPNITLQFSFRTPLH